MNIIVTITAKDVFSQTVEKVDVTISSSSLNISEKKQTSNDGKIDFSFVNLTGTHLFKLKFTSDKFQESDFSFSTDGLFNDRITELTSIKINSSTLTINIIYTLSKVREAPMLYLDSNSLAKITTPINAILLNSNNDYDYKDLFFMNFVKSNSPKDGQFFHYINSNTVCNKIDNNEWERFNNSKKEVIPSNVGRFRWFEYKFSKDKIYIFCIWIPKQLANEPCDYLIYYSPTTAGKSNYSLDIGTPPYGIKKNQNAVTQPYVQLGNGYMFNIHYIVHQIIVNSKKNLCVVFPINNVGQIDFFLGDTNSFESLKEINFFLHRRNYLKSNHIESYRLDKAQYVNQQIPIFDIASIKVAAFSEGFNRLNSLFNNTSKEFQSKWMQIWDTDCAVVPYGGWSSYINKLKSWYSKNSDKRRFILMHSDYTDGNGMLNEMLSTFKNSMPLKTNPGIVEKNGGKENVIIKELHENQNKWSAIYFSDSTVTKDKNHNDAYRPEFIHDPHQFVPNIGIGYSASR